MSLKLQNLGGTAGEGEHAASPSSHFAEYKREREGKLVLERPEGFAVYEFGKDFVYIEDIFVAKSYRKSGVAKDMADSIAAKALSKGINVMVGSVDIRARGSTTSMAVLLAYGMSLDSTNGSVIYLKKLLSKPDLSQANRD